MADNHLLAYVFSGLLLLHVLAKAFGSKLDHIPTVGPSGPLSSYWGLLRQIFQCREVIMEGYNKYPNGMFKIPLMHKWMVFCSSPQLLEDIRKASDDVLSRDAANDDAIQTFYTLGRAIRDNHYHIGVIRLSLPRNLAACFPDLREELQLAFEDNLSLSGTEWKSFHATNLILPVVCRTTNKLVLGLPWCRDPEYLEINTKFTIDVMVTAHTIGLFPKFMRRFIGEIVTKRPRYIQRLCQLIADSINERLKMHEQYGKDWPDKPNDMLSWLIDRAPPEFRTVEDLVTRILTINFASIHTTSLNFIHALYHLAAEPEHIAILREEVDAIVREDGWTKASIDRMVKVDSFLRESQRLNGIATFNMARIALKDFTFSNGVVIPAGTTVAVPMYAIHHDEAIWPDPYTFDPYRSSRLREKDSGDQMHQLVTASPDFLPWGYGKHACPGRFFANIGLKAMLAHVVHSYDVKFEKEGVRPPNVWFAGVCLPDRNAKVMFRKRA